MGDHLAAGRLGTPTLHALDDIQMIENIVETAVVRQPVEKITYLLFCCVHTQSVTRRAGVRLQRPAGPRSANHRGVCALSKSLTFRPMWLAGHPIYGAFRWPICRREADGRGVEFPSVSPHVAVDT